MSNIQIELIELAIIPMAAGFVAGTAAHKYMTGVPWKEAVISLQGYTGAFIGQQLASNLSVADSTLLFFASSMVIPYVAGNTNLQDLIAMPLAATLAIVTTRNILGAAINKQNGGQ